MFSIHEKNQKLLSAGREGADDRAAIRRVRPSLYGARIDFCFHEEDAGEARKNENRTV
jgi:hypothetical protein